MKSARFRVWEKVENDHLENNYNRGDIGGNPATLEELSSELQKLGLSDLEVKLYLTLLTYGTLTAVQAADRSAIPRPRAYDALASLERKGLVARPPVKPTKHAVLSPKESLRGLVDRISEEYSKRVEELSGAADKLARGLQPLFEKRPTGPTDVAWILSGVRNIRGELRAMLSKAEEQLFVSYDPRLDPLHKLRNFGQGIRRLGARGVKLLSFFDLSAPALKHAEEFGKAFGSNVRFGRRPFAPLGVYALGAEQILVAYQSTPASMSFEHLILTAIADGIVYVCEPNDDSIEATKLTAEGLKELMDVRPLGVVINRMPGHVDEKVWVKKVSKLAPVLGVVPEDEAVGEAFRENLPVAAVAPDCPASRAMEEITRELLGAKVKPTKLPEKLERALKETAKEVKK